VKSPVYFIKLRFTISSSKIIFLLIQVGGAFIFFVFQKIFLCNLQVVEIAMLDCKARCYDQRS
jgi:hypothetical protein